MMQDPDELIAYLQKHYECFDRFTFDNHMRYLLKNGCDHEEALSLIMANCSLSAITFQERIHNNNYQKISVDKPIAEDLKKEVLLEKKKLVNKELKRSNRLN